MDLRGVGIAGPATEPEDDKQQNSDNRHEHERGSAKYPVEEG